MHPLRTLIDIILQQYILICNTVVVLCFTTIKHLYTESTTDIYRYSTREGKEVALYLYKLLCIKQAHYIRFDAAVWHGLAICCVKPWARQRCSCCSTATPSRHVSEPHSSLSFAKRRRKPLRHGFCIPPTGLLYY